MSIHEDELARRNDEGTTKEKSNVNTRSSDEDDYILDESGCPNLTKNMFYCLMCGGSDENRKCKGVGGITINSL
jgi:hypothetical protein